MIFDVLLPSVLFLIMLATLFLYFRYEKKIGSVFKEVKLRYYHAVFLVVASGIVVSVLVFIPGEAIRVLFLCVYFLGFFLFTYLVVPKWYLAVLTPALFAALYFFYWNLFTLNLFAILLAIFVSVYLGSLFTWKTTAVFVILITIMDIVHVLITGLMVESSKKMLALNLPIMIIIPTFPSQLSYFMALGLGDIFLCGLLSIQTAQKYGKKFGYVFIMVATGIFLLFHTILLNYYVVAVDSTELPRPFPATVMIISGWLTALAARHVYQSSLLRHG